MSRVLVALTISFLLAACYAGDPWVHVAYERDFSTPVNFDCIEAALRSVVPDVTRGHYEADGIGPRGFERGTTVTQFNYDDPSLRGGYTLDVAAQSDGRLHYWHEWGKTGTKILPEEQRRVVPLLVHVNLSVERRCGLSFSGAVLTVGDG